MKVKTEKLIALFMDKLDHSYEYKTSNERIKIERELIDIAESESKLPDISNVNGSTCWIMHRTADDLIFVTTDEDNTKKLYESGDYIMRQSQIFDPM